MKWIGLSAVVLATVAKTSAQVTPVNVPSYKNWTFTGCFGDNPVNRSLHHIVGGASDTIVETCLDTCDGLGFGFAGLEFSSECYCGNALLYGYGTSDACTMTCSGNSTELCGGPNALSVYGNGKVPLTQGPAVVGTPDPNNFATQNWAATFCLSDDQWQLPGGVRLFGHMPGGSIPAEEMTVNKCILGCATSSYTLAGLENGQECWCDKKSFPFANVVPMSDCSSPCLGNATEICGGPNRLFTYLFNFEF